jgi:hypothetical protein
MDESLFSGTAGPVSTAVQMQSGKTTYCLTELIALFYDAIERIKHFALLVDQQFGITHGIDEQNVGNFQFAFRFDLGGHTAWVARFIISTQPAESTLFLSLRGKSEQKER